MEVVGEFEGEEKWVYDSSVDHEGKVPVRASTGVWKASLFIIAIEFSERLSYFGLATNLVIYLTKILHQDVKTAVKNVNYWIGVTTMMPLVGGFVADAYLGRFYTILASTIIYLGETVPTMALQGDFFLRCLRGILPKAATQALQQEISSNIIGLVLLTASQLVPSLKPCESTTCIKPSSVHVVIFFVAMYMISVGTGGHKPSLESFGADQFDDNHAGERKKKMSYFNWWNCGVCSGVMLGVTVIVYVQDNVSWGTADIVLMAVMGINVTIFLFGKRWYRYHAPLGSPLTPMLQVLVAAVAKRRLPLPADAGELYETPKTGKSSTRLLCHTDQLRFLDKAAIIENAPATTKPNGWRLATVTQVEEVKLVLSIIPVWVSSLPFGMCVAQASTFFVKQGSIMDREMAGGFEMPPASLYSFAAASMIVSVCLYDKLLVPFLRHATGNERGLSILQRIGIGMALAAAAMSVAALVEKKRLDADADSMSVFWLAPQFAMLGVADAFTIVGLQEYFYDQVPDSMRSLGIAFYLSVMGASSFLSSLLINVVDYFTTRGGRDGEGWIGKDLNKSRLDRFYWLIVVINAANLVAYVYVARKYSYKSVKGRVGIANSPEREFCDDHANV